MKKNTILLSFLFVLIVLGINNKTYAQSQPVLYFCEKYDDDDGEIGISDRFYTGPLTVMVKSAEPLGLTDCHIQFDKYNTSKRKFEFYKKFDYKIDRDMKYVFFAKNSTSDMSFDDPGFYRVFLLDKRNKTVASALIEIID